MDLSGVFVWGNFVFGVKLWISNNYENFCPRNQKSYFVSITGKEQKVILSGKKLHLKCFFWHVDCSFEVFAKNAISLK